MIPLQIRRFDRNNNFQPILSNHEIDEYAHVVLGDYKQELLRKPGKINYMHFLESYLGMKLLFYDIYNDEPDRPIVAMTAFKEGKIRVFDKENKCIKKVVVPARSVIIDSSIAEDEKEHFALFSGMHEGGHITMQWHVYTRETFDGDPYDPDIDWNDEIKPLVCCRRSNIEGKVIINKDRSAEDWREYHANYFAAAITMPNRTFLPFVNNLLREHKYYKGLITLGINEDLDILAFDIMPEAISEIYGVSKQAARIKLKTSGFVRSG